MRAIVVVLYFVGLVVVLGAAVVSAVELAKLLQQLLDAMKSVQ